MPGFRIWPRSGEPSAIASGTPARGTSIRGSVFLVQPASPAATRIDGWLPALSIRSLRLQPASCLPNPHPPWAPRPRSRPRQKPGILSAVEGCRLRAFQARLWPLSILSSAHGSARVLRFRASLSEVRCSAGNLLLPLPSNDFVELVEIAADQCSLLRPTPAFDSSFGMEGLVVSLELFGPNEDHWSSGTGIGHGN